MKFLLIISFCLLSPSTWSWEIIKEKDSFFLIDKTFAAKEKVFADKEKTPVEVLILSKDIIVLRYLESKAGTKVITQTYNCSLYNLSSKKMMGVDQLCKTITVAVGGKKTESEASFKINPDNVSYNFEELSENFPLK